MAAPNPNIKVKLIVSYVVFLGMLLGVLLFIYDKVRIYTKVDQSTELQTDNIARLIAEKDLRMLDLVQSIGDLNVNFINTNQELERFLFDSFDAPVLEKKTVVVSDTIVSKERKLRLLDRIVDVFSPEDIDNTVEIKTRIETQVDTVYESAINKESFKKLQAKLRRERVALQVRQSKTEELQLLNAQLTNQIDSLLLNFERKQIDSILTQVEQDVSNRKRAFLWIGSIAIISILLIIVFSSLLVRDINSSNRYRKALEGANKRSEDLLRAREKLMLTITHDIKAPTGTIMGYSDLLKETTLSYSQLEYLRSIDVASEHISKLVHDLLDYHLLDLNKLEFQEDNVNLKGFVDEILGSFTPQYQKVNLSLSANYNDDEIDKWILLDALRVKQILNNLLSNALKFTNQGGVKLSVILDDEKITFKVKDTGVGISPDDKERAFNEFTRLHSAQGKEGFGLGLSIVSKIVNAMDGRITLNSILNKGTTFTVVLPYLQGKEPAEKVSDTYSGKSVSILSGISILLIDDDLLQLKMMKTILENAKASVTTCHNLNSLLSFLDSTKYDVLITDVQMPEITGFDLVCLLKNSNKEAYRSIPIIVTSAQEQFDQVFLDNNDVIGVLHKPFNANDVWKIMSGKDNMDAKVVDQSYEESVDDYGSFFPLLSFVLDDVASQIEILESFSLESMRGIEEIKSALKKDDKALISMICHRMLPIIKMLQRDDICNVLIDIEHHILTLKSEDSLQKIDFLQKEISNLVKEAETLISGLRNNEF